MRILLVTGSYPPMKCGVGAYTQKLASALAEAPDCKVMVLTGCDAGGLEASRSGVDVHAEVPDWRYRRLFRLLRRVKELSPDVVHFQFPTQGYNGRSALLLPLLVRCSGIPCVQTWHEPPVTTKSAWTLALGGSQLIVVKKDLRSHLAPCVRWMLRRKRLAWIPAASMLPTVDLSEAERGAVKASYVQPGTWLLVFYGFVAPLKGLETLLDVVARTPSRLVLAADLLPDNGYHQSLRRLIDDLGIQDRVDILGFQPDQALATLLASADAAVFPFAEGAAAWNTSIDGAVAQGVFVLTTEQGEGRYDPKRHTYYAKSGRGGEMIQALREYVGSRAPTKPSTEAWREIAGAHRAVYRELLPS